MIVRSLCDLLPAAGLRWLLWAAPTRLLAPPELRGALARVLRDERLDLLAATTGLDLRQVPELCLAAYGEEETVLFLVRHRAHATTIERRFRARLTAGETRSVEDGGLVRVSGQIGRDSRVFAAIGAEVVGFQYGGDVERGPARVASLYGARRLRRSPTVTAAPPLGALWAELADAPLWGALAGPFDQELAKGARGLLEAATAVAAALGPTARRTIALALLLGGDFTGDAPRAHELLRASWNDLAASDLGHLLGLGEPRSEPRVTLDDRRMRLDVELDPATLFGGLAAATTEDVREIMR